MVITSSRFDKLDVPLERIITMQRPILGFERLSRFFLLDRPEFHPFLWLHSIDDPTVAFPVVSPRLFFPEFRIEIHSKEVAELMINDPKRVETFVIITIPNDPTDITANLQGPIVINTANNLAKQLVLVNSDYCVAHPLIEADELETLGNHRRERELARV